MSARHLNFRRIAVAVALLAIVLYGGAVGYLASQETRLVFAHGRPLGPDRPAPPFEQVDLARPDRAPQFAWIMRQADGDPPWLLYLYGNRATVGSRTNLLRYEGFRALGLNVLAPEYRGYDGLPGSPSEGALTGDARVGYDYLRNVLRVPPERIVIFGWSLGSAVAVSLASEVPSGRDPRGGTGIAGSDRRTRLSVDADQARDAQSVRIDPAGRPHQGADAVPAQP